MNIGAYNAPTDNLPDIVKLGADATSVGIIVATILNWLPTVSVILTILWMVLRIVEAIPKAMDAYAETKKKLKGKKDDGPETPA